MDQIIYFMSDLLQFFMEQEGKLMVLKEVGETIFFEAISGWFTRNMYGWVRMGWWLDGWIVKGGEWVSWMGMDVNG